MPPPSERRHRAPTVPIGRCLPPRRSGRASIAAISPATVIRAGTSVRRSSARTPAAATSLCISARSAILRWPRRSGSILYARLNIDLPGARPAAAAGQRSSGVQPGPALLRVRERELGAMRSRTRRPAPHRRYARRSCGTPAPPDRCGPASRSRLRSLCLPGPPAVAPASRFEPWPGRSPYLVAGYRIRRDENRTPRIPEPIIAPLLAWSLRYVADIRAGYLRCACRAHRAPDAPRTPASPMTPVLSNRGRRRCSASASSPFSMTAVGTDAACRSGRPRTTAWFGSDARTGAVDPAGQRASSPSSCRHRRSRPSRDAHLQLATGAPDLIAAAVDELGVEVGGMDTPISINAETGRPWRPRFDVKTLAPRRAHAPGRRLCRLRLPHRHARLRGAGHAFGLSVAHPQRGWRHHAPPRALGRLQGQAQPR